MRGFSGLIRTFLSEKINRINMLLISPISPYTHTPQTSLPSHPSSPYRGKGGVPDLSTFL
jgi:hypothetical protein